MDRTARPTSIPVWVEAIGGGAGPAFAFIRWIGDDRNGPEGDRELQSHATKSWLPGRSAYRRPGGTGKAVFGYVHNPYEGHAPASVRRLQTLLAAQMPLPPWPPAERDGQAQLRLL